MPDRVVHFELPYDDEERAAAFYRDTFDWRIEKWTEGDYLMVTTGPTTEEGMPAEPGFISGGMLRRPHPDARPVVTIAVDDIDATLARVQAGGGSVVMPKEPVAQMGYTAYFTDPEGNVMGLWQNAE